LEERNFMRPSELAAFLKRIQTHPKKSLSQNFLIDSNIIRKIIETAEITPGESILEIGSGPGALTAALLDKGAQVCAVEIDHTFAKELHRFQNGNLQVIEGDFLKVPSLCLPKRPKIVANLPYHITTPILEKIFSHPFSSLIIMVQKEVGDRMRAEKGKNFGPLSLFVQFYASYQNSFIVPPACFYPRPTVESMVIRQDSILPREVDIPGFFQLIRRSFQKRRKMLTSTLPIEKETTRQALLKIGKRTDARPEELTFSEWMFLFKEIEQPLSQCKK